MIKRYINQDDTFLLFFKMKLIRFKTKYEKIKGYTYKKSQLIIF